MPIHAFATKKAKQPLEKFDYDPHALGPYDIEVKITHCGICHSDLSLIDNEWGISTYPLVPGHEIIGTITAVGPNITDLKKGQRVGIGWQRSSCMNCEWCHRGEENLCLQQEATCVGHHGGFADRIITDGRFAFPIPDALASENAAPLLCGGATVYSPFMTFDIRPTARVGVIGIGGLGHLALQFARAFGCEVTAFSSTPAKEAEAKNFGAHHFIPSTDKGAMKKGINSLDFILNTVMAPLNWEEYMQLLRPKGILCFVGAVTEPLKVAPVTMIGSRKTISASNIADRPDINEMLRFAAQKGIKAQTELFPMQEANKAVDKLRANKVRYRAVLLNSQ